jgi:hypothetical protein
VKRILLKWHNALLWFGLTTIVVWSLSGISHPLMAWFGPQAVKMYPPKLSISSNDALSIQKVISGNNLSTATIAKVVPTSTGAMLQLTEQITENALISRRYFSLVTQQEVENFDEQQARWLAAYYTDRDINQINHVKLIDKFSHEYPSINRLLPVYRVDISHNGETVIAYIYTETNTLASITNDTKRRLQSFFQILHTWSYLDFTGHGRVLLIGLLMLTLIAMASSGLMLVIKLPRRRMKSSPRRWHRRLAYALWLPMLAWPASGFYHLLQAQYVEPVIGMRLSSPTNLQNWLINTTSADSWQRNFASSIGSNKQLNAISLVSAGNKIFYRLSIAPQQSEIVNRNDRFDGKVIEKSVVYINSSTGLTSPHTDKDQALQLLKNFTSSGDHKDIQLVTHFGPGYDFRNKRLPVWQIDLADQASTRIFVDPMTSMLVDQNRGIDRLEALSFSILHKWNHLFPLIGRQWRDVLIVMTLIASLILSGFGLQTYLARKTSAKKPQS